MDHLWHPEHWVKSFTYVISHNSAMAIVICLVLQEEMRQIAQEGQSQIQTQIVQIQDWPSNPVILKVWS